jgi:hypothetical protein
VITVSVGDLSYHRVILDDARAAETALLRDEVDYSFVVSHGTFEDTAYEVTNRQSCVIDLRPGIERVIERFHPTSRNELRRAEKIEGLTFHSAAADPAEVHAFHTACERDRGWFPVPPDELRQSALFLARFDGELIAGMSCYSHGAWLRTGRIFSSRRSRRSDRLTNLVYGVAGKRIALEACKAAVAGGMHFLDLGGVDPDDASKSGITQFKLSLGGEVKPVRLGRWRGPRFGELEARVRAEGWDLT